eukprot:6473844-Amphidinium_carterae.1
MLWTDALLVTGAAKEEQLHWLENVLSTASSDERHLLRPWIIVAGHGPLYCSMARDTPTCSDDALALRQMLEPLFQKFKVDLYLAAKLNAYERTYPVHDGRDCESQRARRPGRIRNTCQWTVHVLEGNAGDPPLQYHGPPATWTAYRWWAQPGYGEITVHNATHLHYRQILAPTATQGDDFWLLKAE